jgi:hypothetical protein
VSVAEAGSRAVTNAGSMPTSGGAGGAVAGSGAGGADADSDLSNSCPQALNEGSCPATQIDIRFTREPVVPRAGIWVEPLQIPIPKYTQDPSENLPEIEPSKWDRSSLPAGACVLRIHGRSGSCLRRGLLFAGTCASRADPNASLVVPFSYYEGDSCRQGIAPGCPSASASDSNNGYWWYLVGRGEATDLVVCAPQCGTLFHSVKHGCLSMVGSG